MYDFGDWAAQIDAVSSLPEFQNCTVEILDPTLITSVYDIETDTFTQSGDGRVEFADGSKQTQARVIGIRADRPNGGAATDNPTGIQSIRVQIPFSQFPGRVMKDWHIRIVDGGRNPALESYLFSVTADTFSGARASHTIHAVVNVESEVSWSVPTQITGSVTDANGDPVSGVEVRGFSDENGYWILEFEAQTGADGFYALSGTDSSKQYVVAFLKDGYEPVVYDGHTGFTLDDGDLVAHNATGVDAVLVEA